MTRMLMMAAAFCAALGLAAAGWADDGWKLVMDKNGIKSYSRKVEGSNILEFRAVTVIEAPIHQVGEVVRDIPSYPEWVPFCSEGQELEKIDRNNLTVYIYLDFTWPVADRDIVPKAATVYDLAHGRAVTAITDTVLDSCPPKKGVVRLPEFKGTYVFEYITENKTGVIYTYRADVGGVLPTALVNTFSRLNMFWTFRNLKKIANEPRYQELAEKSPDRDVVRKVLEAPEHLKAVMIARLREFVGSREFIDMMAGYDGLYGVMSNNDGAVVQALLYGWGSDESKKEAIRGVLAGYMEGKSVDEDVQKRVLNDDALIDAIFSGAPGDYCVECTLEKYLNPAAQMAVYSGAPAMP